MNRLFLPLLISVLAGSGPATALPLQQLTIHGPHADQLALSQAAQVNNARQMALAPDGTLFVGTRRAGKVWALQDTDRDGQYEQRYLLASGLGMPSGIAFHQGTLYIADIGQILRLPDILSQLASPPEPETLPVRLPDDSHHGWKYLRVGPDGWLYFNIGAPCNICLSQNPLYASIVRLPLSGGEAEIIAHGVRNSVGFDWDRHGSLWFSDNGRDHWGDDRPDDELNRLGQPGQHFGYPFLHADNLKDPIFGKRSGRLSRYQPPKALLGAHVAPLGIHFYRNGSLAGLDRNSLLVAEHGSWNRSRKVGYRVVQLQVNGTEVVSQTVLIDGWLQGQRHWGRPVDIIEDLDGTLLISDDHAGVIYRLCR
ncbi:PQQ-dependent sugar dehydrogenase [Marinobacterium jannaschii]|uniref:PQQ-dependent sugar dehydrogenase n=1 Tax=Marinobacterium jannaschii TaxID=64970 RepID=UPI00047FDCCF|nr:PQQ-dependent sugar dehydrogenase [Marinobacterium jannaschii]